MASLEGPEQSGPSFLDLSRFGKSLPVEGRGDPLVGDGGAT